MEAFSQNVAGVSRASGPARTVIVRPEAKGVLIFLMECEPVYRAYDEAAAAAMQKKSPNQPKH